MRNRKVGPPRRPAAHLYTITEMDALQFQLKLRGLKPLRFTQLPLPGLAAHIGKPMETLHWRDEKGRDWVAHAQ